MIRNSKVVGLAGLFGTIALVGCSGVERSSDDGYDSQSSAVDEAAATADYAAGKKLIGNYAERVRYAAIINQATLGNPRAVYTLYMIASISDDPANKRVVLNERPCRLDFKATQDVSIGFPDATVQAIGALQSTLDVKATNGQVMWSRSTIGVPFGFRTAPGQELTGPIPTSSSSSDVIDLDADGHPGVTIHVAKKLGFLGNASGVAYFAARINETYSNGTLTSRGNLVGKATTTLENRIFETHIKLGGSELPVDLASLPLSSDPAAADKDTIELVKQTAALSCADLQGTADNLFAGPF